MAPSATSDRPPNPRQPTSLLCVRLTLILLAACLAGLSVYMTSTLTSLNTKFTKEQTEINSLQQKVKSQQAIIARFNRTVTNSDIEDEVTALRSSLRGTEEQLQSEMQTMETRVKEKLNRTVSELDQTVAMAEQEIRAEVTLVKQEVAKNSKNTQDQFSTENDFMKFQLAGTFTLLGGLISMWHMTGHIRNFNTPFVQRKIMAILWMSPIYSVTSWLSLVLPQFEGYLAIIKDFYEAYVIYQFLGFLISVLGKGDRATVVDLLAHHADHLEPPLRCCGWFRGKYPSGDSARVLADDILLQCQLFTMQFVFFKPMTAIGLFTCNKLGYYGGGTSGSDYRSPQFWFNIIQNVSVFMAFSGLIKFYHAVQDELAWCKPFPKFLCIKGIVFMTFWQGLVISILANATVEAGGKAGTDSDAWGKQAQNFLICLEMLLFSIAHFYCFPTEEWEEGYRPSQEKKAKFGESIALGDFVSDLKLLMGSGVKRKSNKKLKSVIEDEDDTDESADSGRGDNDSNVNDNDSVTHSDGGDSIDASDIKQVIEDSLNAPNANLREAAQRIVGTTNVITSDGSMQAMGNVSNVEEELEPNETTSLLGAADAENDNTILRPSLFTAT